MSRIGVVSDIVSSHCIGPFPTRLESPDNANAIRRSVWIVCPRLGREKSILFHYLPGSDKHLPFHGFGSEHDSQSR